MADGESLRSGSAKSFGLWKLRGATIVVLGNEFSVDDDAITHLYLAGKIAETHEHEFISTYRTCDDAEAAKRVAHIARWGVLDLHAVDARKSRK